MTRPVYISILALSPLCLGARSLPPVSVLTLLPDPPLALTLSGASAIQLTGLTVDTVVDVRNSLVGVVADDVLPRLAPFAENRASIVFIELTDAFDGVRFFFVGRGRVRNSTIGDRGAERSGDRIGIRCGVRDGEGGGICHSLTDYPLSGHGKIRYVRVQNREAEPSPYNEHVNDCLLRLTRCRSLLIDARRVRTGYDSERKPATSTQMKVLDVKVDRRNPSID